MDTVITTVRLAPTIEVEDPTGTSIAAASTVEATMILSNIARSDGKPVTVREIDADGQILDVFHVSKSGEITAAKEAGPAACAVKYLRWYLTGADGTPALTLATLAMALEMAQNLADQDNTDVDLAVDTVCRQSVHQFQPTPIPHPEPHDEQPDMAPLPGVPTAAPLEVEPVAVSADKSVEAQIVAELDAAAPSASSMLLEAELGFLANYPPAPDHAPTAGMSAKPVKPRTSRKARTRSIAVSAALVIGLLSAGGISLANILTPVPPAATSPTTLPPAAIKGWAATPTWATPILPGSPAILSSTGEFAGIQSTDGTFTVVSTKDPKAPVASTDGGADARPVTVGGKAGFLQQRDTSLQLWLPGDATMAEIRIKADQKLIIRSGRPFVTDKDFRSNSAAVTAGGLVPYIAPEPGVVPFSLTKDQKMVWAGTRSRLLTTAPDAKNPSTVTLATPTKAGALTRIVAVTDTHVLSVWGNDVLALHELATGKLITSAPVAAETATKDSLTSHPDSPLLVFAAQVINTDAGTIEALEPGDKPLAILGNSIYLKRETQRVLFTPGQPMVDVPEGVTLVGIDAAGQLIMTTNSTMEARSPE